MLLRGNNYGGITGAKGGADESTQCVEQNPIFFVKLNSVSPMFVIEVLRHWRKRGSIGA
ncbi:MAG: hypothetical protein WBC04_00100 [Candidatus Acidiferrales bacterium]